MFGDILEKNIYKLKNSSSKKNSENAFWRILKEIAIEELKEYSPKEIDSSCAIEIYYKILKKNESYLPDYFKEKNKSNNQERYRVANRNVWTSNSRNKNGLSDQRCILAIRKMNEEKCGYKTIYSWRGEKCY